ncbi:phage late control D family protein [[Clostridium] colinum]|uniref:phage late control D family protein n=1 Tax=[Clostridium] colinum TaxID=36835 RepID=UPI002023CD13|nr:phage late control D family protein [[Clostridium] colinum]
MNIVTEDLTIDLPFKYKIIENLELKEELNEHSNILIKGILDNEKSNIQRFKELSITDNLKIKGKRSIYENEMKEKLEEIDIFYGVITKIKLNHEGNLYNFEIEAMSYSIMLDLKKKNRSFQDKSLTYRKLIDNIVKENNGNTIFIGDDTKTLHIPFIQYNETDWEFLKRLSSYLELKLCPDIKTEKPNIFVGIKKGKEYICDAYEYKLKKDMKTYLNIKANHMKVTEEDFISYEIKAKYNYEIGDKLIFKNLKLVVVKKYLEFKNSDLINTYELKLERNIKQEKLYNDKIIGQVINGKVIKVEKDKIKVHLEIDEKQEEDKAYLYSFGSNYTTEGNTGWYVMPEIGSKIELYIPTKSEKDAYLRRVLREDGRENENTQDTSVKYFRVKEGKELKMSPNELKFTTNGESLYLSMEDNKGVSIISNENINMYSQKNIKIESEKLKIKSNDKIAITTKDSNIVIDEVTHFN